MVTKYPSLTLPKTPNPPHFAASITMQGRHKIQRHDPAGPQYRAFFLFAFLSPILYFLSPPYLITPRAAFVSHESYLGSESSCISRSSVNGTAWFESWTIRSTLHQWRRRICCFGRLWRRRWCILAQASIQLLWEQIFIPARPSSGDLEIIIVSSVLENVVGEVHFGIKRIPKFVHITLRYQVKLAKI
jgi:hypothetical protein